MGAAAVAHGAVAAKMHITRSKVFILGTPWDLDASSIFARDPGGIHMRATAGSSRSCDGGECRLCRVRAADALYRYDILVAVGG